MHQAVALAAVGVGGILHGHKFRLELTLRVECGRVPAISLIPAVACAFHQTGAHQGSGVGPTERAILQGGDTGVVVGIGQVTQEAVHLHPARRSPVPGCGLTRGGVQHRGLRVAGIRGQVVERAPVAGVHRRPAAHVAVAETFHPLGRAQVEQGIAGGGEIAVAQRVPAAEGAGAGVPGAAVCDRAGLAEFVQAHGGVIAVGLDEGGVVAGAARLERGDGLARCQHIDFIGVQQGKLRVQWRGLLQRAAGRLGRGPGQAQPGQNRSTPRMRGMRKRCGVFIMFSYFTFVRPPHSMGSPG